MPLLPLALTLLQGGDLRLAVRATLERPRVTFAEFGAWVQNRTHVPVFVSPAIRERKATVLVTDRPVQETMDRFAETFFLDWETTNAGLRLRLNPKVAAEEAVALDVEARRRAANFRDLIEAAMALSKLSREEIRAAEGAARADPKSLRRYYSVAQVSDNPMALMAGELLAGLSPARREAVLAGERAFGSDHGGTRVVKISGRWTTQGLDDSEGAKVNGTEEKPWPTERTLLVTIKGDPQKDALNVMTVDQQGDDDALGYHCMVLNGRDIYLPEEGPIDVRLRAWARADASALATPLTKESESLATHSTERHSLADLLLALHRRSGLSVVADGFREAVERSSADDTNLAGWLRTFPYGPRGETPLYHARTREGWIMLRRTRYWERLDHEPSEAAVTNLERATPSLDAFAAFAATVTPAQESYLSPDQLVMDVPNAALADNLAVLRLWHALTKSERRRAMDGGLRLSDLPDGTERLAMESVKDIEWSIDVDQDAVLPHLVPGGPPFPKDLTFSVETRGMMSDSESPFQIKYAGCIAHVVGGGREYARFRLPLRENVRTQ